jgi:hypothetical protein
MWRDGGGIVAGVASWWLVAAAGFVLLRASSPDYALAEASADFTAAMLLARLLVGLASSFVAGSVCGAISGRDSIAPWIAAALMLLLLVPIHYSEWDSFPNWYHLVFLGTLVPVIGHSAKLATRYSGSL